MFLLFYITVNIYCPFIDRMQA